MKIEDVLLPKLPLHDLARVNAPDVHFCDNLFATHRWNSLFERRNRIIARSIAGGFAYGREAFLSRAIETFHLAAARSGPPLSRYVLFNNG